MKQQRSHCCKAGETAKLPISPLVGEMSGRTEGGAVPPTFNPLQLPHVNSGNETLAIRRAPPLPCRASPPQGGKIGSVTDGSRYRRP
ncbi:hypothetical protein EOC93_18385 [Mesorhizobium sp. M6A.T.Ce.TU.002.03.1.1]|nr:hypothetical protein EOC93_18385 [Mesorhizobium sp. M6A.T.Ce.TU.002.03.1.1]